MKRTLVLVSLVVGLVAMASKGKAETRSWPEDVPDNPCELFVGSTDEDVDRTCKAAVTLGIYPDVETLTAAMERLRPRYSRLKVFVVAKERQIERSGRDYVWATSRQDYGAREEVYGNRRSEVESLDLEGVLAKFDEAATVRTVVAGLRWMRGRMTAPTPAPRRAPAPAPTAPPTGPIDVPVSGGGTGTVPVAPPAVR